MRRKALVFVVIAVIVVLGATAAYAWWTASDALTGNTVETGTLGVDVQGRSGPINVTGLAPSNAPAFAATNPVFALNEQDVTAEAPFPHAYFWVHNTGDIREMFYAWASVTAESAGIRDKVMCRIWLNPQDYPDPVNPDWWKAGKTYCVWQGPLSDIDTPEEGRARIRTATPSGDFDPLPADTYAVYKIIFWLDSSAGPGTMDQSLAVDLKIEAGQEEAWGSF